MYIENCRFPKFKWVRAKSTLPNITWLNEFLIIGTKQQLAKINIDSILIGEDNIEPTHCVRDLGAWFDENLSMDVHVSKVCAKAFRSLFMLKQIRPCLTRKACETVVHAFISSHLDYCNSLLYGISDYLMKRLQSIQNSAARLIYKLPKFSRNISLVCQELHWLPVRYRIIFKVILYVFKALHGLAPRYLKDSLVVKCNTSYSLRSSSAGLLLEIPRTTNSAGDNSFYVCGPKLWNDLPLELRSCNEIEQFKSKLKTHLFVKAYSH